ncbi:MAG: CoA ester lyase [Hyphomicrobiales bacterium]|nr:MAG: CoA ester lyase [Hyphomicrobiales bacterium]
MNFSRRRSVLYVPASNTKAMAKTAALQCDAVIFDLEDAVAAEVRPAARQNLRDLFHASAQRADQERIIRINAVGGVPDAEDIAVAAVCKPDAVLVPKVEASKTLAAVRQALDAQAAREPIRLWAMIETPMGIVNLREICQRGSKPEIGLRCLVAGSNDIAKEAGLPLGSARATIEHWLAAIVIHAKAFRLDSLDGVFNDFRDEEGFEHECASGAKLGFDGKSLIHPNQIAPANATFSPSEDAIREARAVIEAFEDPVNAGAGVISVGGKMVERLHLEIARRVLAHV